MIGTLQCEPSSGCLHPSPPLSRSRLTEPSLLRFAANCGCAASRPRWSSLKSMKTGGIIFSSSQLASQLCFRTPDTVADLLQARRVAFLNGPVSMPFAKVPDVAVDLVVVEWQRVAERIVDDLISQEAFRHGPVTIFEAEAKLRIALSEFAHSI